MVGECEKLKTLSDIASSQASHTAQQQKSDQKELELLRGAISDLQMQTDNKLILGQLHQHILTLQKSESEAHKQNLDLKTKCLRLEKTIIQLEGEMSHQNKVIFDLRMKTKNRIEILQKSLSDFRLRFCGSILIEKHERACDAAKRLSDINLGLEKKVEQMSKEKFDVETENNLLSAKASLYNELVSGIKETGSAVEKRLASWHSKMVEAQSQKLKYQRESQKERERYNALKESAEVNGKRVEELEDLIMEMQNEQDGKLLEWQTQQTAYEQMIAYFEEERDRLYLTTNAVEVRDLLPDRTLPVGEQLELSIRLLIERTRENKLLSIKNTQLENQLKESAKSLTETDHLLNVSNLELKKLQALNECIEKEAKNSADHGKDGILSDKSRIREAKALHFAHETTLSLQRQIEQKNDLIQKYRDMLQKVRADLREESSVKDSLITDLNTKIQELTQREIQRVQEIPEINSSKDEKDVIGDVKLIEEMQQLLEAKDLALKTLQNDSDQLMFEFNKEKSADEEEIAKLQQELVHMSEEKHLLKEKNTQLSIELGNITQVLSGPKVKDLSDVVKRLQNDVEAKDQKLTAQKKVIQNLKDQMVALSKEVNDVKSNDFAVSPNGEDLLIQQKMATKIASLETKHKK